MNPKTDKMKCKKCGKEIDPLTDGYLFDGEGYTCWECLDGKKLKKLDEFSE